MESIHGIKQTTTMRTQVIPTTEQVEKRIAQPTNPITSKPIKPRQQQQKNKHMKTANLPSAITGLFNARKHKLNSAAKAGAPSIFSRMLTRAKRAISLLTLLFIMIQGFIQQGFSQSISIF